MQLRYWLGARYWVGMGLKTLQHILPQLTDLSELFTCPEPDLQDLGLPISLIAARANIDWQAIDVDLKWAEEPCNRIMSYADPDYPAALRTIAVPPLILYVRGNLQALTKPCLAIVGARQPTPTGKETSFAFAQAMVELGFSVSSGLAYGVDAAAHQGALTANGHTLAVLGSGLAHIYPRAHIKLAKQIIEYGLLLSEFPPHMPPQAQNFPRRNRIISGLSLGVLVIEAALQSGSLITAHYALEQGREVFAVPGSIYNHLARGCHLLIRQGAKLVESIQDILVELKSSVDFLPNNGHDVQLLGDSTHRIATLTPDQQTVWLALDDAPNSIDQLLVRSQLSLAQLRHALVRLELNGYVCAVPGGYQRRWPAR